MFWEPAALAFAKVARSSVAPDNSSYTTLQAYQPRKTNCLSTHSPVQLWASRFDNSNRNFFGVETRRTILTSLFDISFVRDNGKENIRSSLQAVADRWFGRWKNMHIVSILGRCVYVNVYFNDRWVVVKNEQNVFEVEVFRGGCSRNLSKCRDNGSLGVFSPPVLGIYLPVSTDSKQS